MATAKKLPSGSWRCLAYSHTEKTFDEKIGKWKNKRIYESFTSDDPSPRGKKEAEAAAALFQLNKEKQSCNRDYRNITLSEAIDAYINNRSAVLSPTTLQDYRCIQKQAFPELMKKRLKEIDTPLLQSQINIEAMRPTKSRGRSGTISPKRLSNEWGLVATVLKQYKSELNLNVTLPQRTRTFKELIPPQIILQIIKGTDIELPVLLAMWLSFTMSEIKGLTKSKSINGNYITIREVLVKINSGPVKKENAKNYYRNRRHRIPPYIRELIEKVDGDVIVPMPGSTIYKKWCRLLEESGLPHMTFHDLRHENASIMALLKVPDKYAQERGGWKTDAIMKEIYTQTFSDERIKVDDMIDAFFESMQHEMQHGTKKVP